MWDEVALYHDPLLTPVLGEVFSSLAPLRYKGSESVSYIKQLHPTSHKKGPHNVRAPVMTICIMQMDFL